MFVEPSKIMNLADGSFRRITGVFPQRQQGNRVSHPFLWSLVQKSVGLTFEIVEEQRGGLVGAVS